MVKWVHKSLEVVDFGDSGLRRAHCLLWKMGGAEPRVLGVLAFPHQAFTASANVSPAENRSQTPSQPRLPERVSPCHVASTKSEGRLPFPPHVLL